MGFDTTKHREVRTYGFALVGKKALMLAVDPKGDLTKMLGQRKPHGLPLTLANAMNDVVAGTMPRDHTEIMCHHEGFDFVPGTAACRKRPQNFFEG